MTRLEQLRKSAQQEGLDALILTSPVARRYMTGFTTSDGLVLVTPEESFFITDFRYIEAARERVKDFTVLMSTREKTQRDIVMEKLKDKKTVALGYEADTMTVEWLEKWKKNRKLSLRPAQKLLHTMRLVKDEQEIQTIERAQGIAEQALTDVLENVIRPGLTERELCAELVYRVYKYGADAISFAPIVVSGPNSALPHGEPGDRVLQRGDCVTIDMGAKLDGYCSDMTRTVVLGEAGDEVRRVYDTVLRAQIAGIEAVHAGRTGKQIDAAAREVIQKAGYGEYFGHGFGHGVGLEVHEQPTAGPSGETPMPAGAVITAEPGIYLPGRFGVRIEDMLVVTENGSRNLTHMPKELLIIG